MKEFHIAIVGAGPAGYFAAQALQNAQSDNPKLSTWWVLTRSRDHFKIIDIFTQTSSWSNHNPEISN